MEPTFSHPSHVRFFEKARKECGKHNVFFIFSRSKLVNSGDGDGRVRGYFQPPIGGRAGYIKVALGEGPTVAFLTLGHEWAHFKQFVRNKRRWLARALSGSLKHYKRYEINAETRALKLLKREGVKIDYRVANAAVKRYVRDIKAIREV